MIDGREYLMDRHGFALSREFKCIHEGDSKIIFELRENETTLSMYPYRFRLIVTHSIKNDGFITEYNVENTDNKPVFFSIGGHPSFNAPFDGIGEFSDHRIVFPCKVTTSKALTTDVGNEKTATEGQEYETDTIKLSHELFNNGAIYIENAELNMVQFVNEKTGNGFDFFFNGFCVLALWTFPGKNAPFICLEPWHGMGESKEHSGLFTEKKYVISLNPNESYSASYGIKLRKA